MSDRYCDGKRRRIAIVTSVMYRYDKIMCLFRGRDWNKDSTKETFNSYWVFNRQTSCKRQLIADSLPSFTHGKNTNTIVTK